MRHSLVCHPDTPARHVTAVAVEITMTDPDDMLLTYRVEPADRVSVPEPASPERKDGLWRQTCFELFIATGAGHYVEFNFSPSSQWAAYSFDGYRSGMSSIAVAVEPHIELVDDDAALMMEADVDLAGTPLGPLTIGLSAVIEEIDGTKSYWALNHPPGAPDFHHPDCFALELPAPDGP